MTSRNLELPQRAGVHRGDSPCLARSLAGATIVVVIVTVLGLTAGCGSVAVKSADGGDAAEAGADGSIDGGGTTPMDGSTADRDGSGGAGDADGAPGGSGGRGGGGAGGGGTGGSAPACTGTGVSTGCNDGFNCAAGRCVPATVSCAAQKSSYPDSRDGVYWVSPPTMRAYCDMSVPIDLCTEIMQEHRGGRTRDGSNLTFALTSVLLWGEGECALWALRALPEGIPFTRYFHAHPLTTCQAFGFIADGQLGGCAYGDDAGRGSCGFGAAPLYQLSDQCAGCVVGDGIHDQYTRMGPIHSSTALTSFDPSTQARCKVR